MQEKRSVSAPMRTTSASLQNHHRIGRAKMAMTMAQTVQSTVPTREENQNACHVRRRFPAL